MQISDRLSNPANPLTLHPQATADALILTSSQHAELVSAWCAGGSATVLNFPPKGKYWLRGTHYTHVNAMAMYRPHRMRPRGGPGNPTEVHFWQESLRNCTNAAGESGIPSLVWGGPAAADSSSLAVKGPKLGPLLECVAARLAAADRHHKGLLALYKTQSLPSRYLPSMRHWNQGPFLPNQCNASVMAAAGCWPTCWAVLV